jgi:DHA2 family multidrug resistance protein
VLEARSRRGEKTDYFGITTIVIGVGLLQYVLDKGQELDWLDSIMIHIAGGIAVTTLILMIWREWTHAHPIIQFRLLKNRNFASRGMH